MIVFKILKWFFLSIISLLIIWAIGRFLFCGPDKSILKITDPLAKEIVDYINEHGRPKSLADIPSLPYEMEGCRKMSNSDGRCDNGEKCSFTYKKIKFNITIDYGGLKDNGLLGCDAISIKSTSMNTVVFYYIKEENGLFKIGHVKLDTIHDSFFCKNGYLKVG